MTILDRYILRKFFTIFLFVILGMIVVFVVIDLIENLDKFLSYHARTSQVVLYYFYYIPFIIILTLPIDVLISTLFSMGTMAQHNEVIACQSAGISLYRLLAPVLIAAFFISVLTGLATETVVVDANRARLDLYRFDIKKEKRLPVKTRNQIALQDGPNRQVFIRYYNESRKIARSVTIIFFDSTRITRRLDAQRMEWDEQNHFWILHQVAVRTFQGTEEVVMRQDTLHYIPARIQPSDLMEMERKPEEMKFTELRRFIQRMQGLGIDVRKWLVDLHMKIAYPFTNFIIVLFGAPLASRKRRSGPAVAFAVALLITFVYFIFLQSGQVLGHDGTLPPWLAAWLGNIVFGLGGIGVLIAIRK